MLTEFLIILIKMTYLNIEAVYVTLVLITVYIVYIIARHVLKHSQSLLNQESIHRALMIIGGMLIGMGIGTQVKIPNDPAEINRRFVNPSSPEFINNQFYFGILIIALGLIIIKIGSYYLRIVLWSPMEQISEYSAEFGKSFIATRLPIVGGRELRRFSERFNDNVLTLANQISSLEIQIDFLKNSTQQTINASEGIKGNSGNIMDFLNRYNNSLETQTNVIENLNNDVNKFITWYNEAQERFDDRFNEISSLAELGNMISVNTSIEVVNLQIDNPGIETIAAKLHDLSDALEKSQVDLGELLREVKLQYSSFNDNITSKLENINNIVLDTKQLYYEMEKSIKNIRLNENDVFNSSQKLLQNLEEVLQALPNAF